MFQFLIFNDIEWEDPPRGYYLSDVKQKVLWEDPNTGATLALARALVFFPTLTKISY